MPRIRVISERGLFHNASNFKAWSPGVYDFPDDERFSGWLAGQVECGNCRLAPDAELTATEVAEIVTGENATQPDYQDLSNKQLQALAKERGIEVSARANKEQLVAALTAGAPAVKNEEQPEGEGEVAVDVAPVAEPGAVSSDNPMDHRNMPDALPRGSAR